MGVSWRSLKRFVTEMDARAATSAMVSAILLLTAMAIFLYGRDWFGLDDASVDAWLSQARGEPWAAVAVVAIFTGLAMTGFPQFLMISATVLAFGPALGAGYSWVATMISASVTFALGRVIGRAGVKRFAGERATAALELAGRHGALASGLVRVVPSAPFIVVNAAAGAAGIALWKFWLGTGLGIVPKIALIAALGAVASDASGAPVAMFTPTDVFALAAILVGWLAFMLVARRLYLRYRRDE